MKKVLKWLFDSWTGGYCLGIMLGVITGIMWYISFLNLQTLLK